MNKNSSRERLINQAIKYHSKGDIKKAAKYYQHLIDQGFRDYIVFSNYGTILNDLGKLTEPVINYKKAIELKPNSSDAHYNLGISLKKLGKLQEAKSSYSKAIELNPNLAIAHSNLGNLLRDLGKVNEE